MSLQHRGMVVAGLLVAMGVSCSSPGQVAREEHAPPATVTAVPIDAGVPAAITTDAAIAATIEASPDAGVDARVFVNPFAGKPCPAPRAVKRRTGKGDQSTELTGSILQPSVDVTYEVGDPDLPRDDVLDISPPEEEVFCGVIESIRLSAVHIAIEGAKGPERRTVFVTVAPPLSLPFGVGSAVVVHAREVALMGTGVRLSAMITDERGELLLAQIEGAGDAYAPGFHLSTGPVPAYRGHGTPGPNSPPQLAPRRAVYVARGGKRAVSKETWRVLDTSDGRFAVWGVSEPITARRSSSAAYVTRLRIVRMQRPVAAQCSAERWNGWEGTAQCRKAAARHIAGPDRRCERDSDCVLLGTSCDPHAVSATAAARYRSWPAPCTPPGAGNCSGPRRAVCDQGCCHPDLLGSP